MVKIKYFLAVTLITVLMITMGACATSAPADDSDTSEGLFDVTWILESYGEPGDLKDVIEDSRATAVFDDKKNKVTGSASCNSYFGGIVIDGSKLSVSDLANTEMYCMEPEGVMDQETEYLTILRAAESFEIKDGKLQINSGDDILVFKAE